MSRTRAVLLFAILLAVFALDASGLTLYVRRSIVAEPGPLSVADVVQPRGEVSPELRKILEKQIAGITDRLLVVPSGLYRPLLQSAGADLILVGRRTLIVPRGSAAEGAVALVDRLVERMDGLGWLGQGATEIEIVRMSGLAAGQTVEDPVFTVLWSDSRSGPLAGEAELAFRGTASPGSTASGKILLRVRPGTAAAPEWDLPGPASGIRANDPVTVRFRRGLVNVEMAGRALAPTLPGEQLMVYVSDVRKSFSGTLDGEKVVNVELP